MTDSAEGLEIENLRIGGNSYQEAGEITDDEENVIGSKPSIENPSEIEAVKGNVDVGVCNKNLIKFAKEDWIGGYFNSDGTVNSWGGTKEGLIDSKYYMISSNLINVVLSFMPLRDLKIARGGIAFYGKDKNPISSTGININENILYSKGIRGSIKANVNIPNGAKYFRFYLKWIRNSQNETINMYDEFYDYISELQMEVGTEGTEYVPFEEQRLRLPLQKEMYAGDYLSEDGEHHVMKRMVIDGTEKWAINGKEEGYENNPQTFSLGGITDMKLANINYVQKNVWCNWSLCGLYPRRSIGNGVQYGIECGGRCVSICLEKFNDFTLDEFKTYLAEQYENGTPLEIVYELENEEFLPYTEEQQEAYKQLKNLKTYKGITHIDSVTDGLRPILSFCYRKDLQIENDRIKARLDEIEALLSTTATSALLLDNLENDLESEVM